MPEHCPELLGNAFSRVESKTLAFKRRLSPGDTTKFTLTSTAAQMYINDQHKRAVEVAQKTGIRLQLHSDSICTACQYLHRFYAFMEKMKTQAASSSSSGDENCDYDVGIVASSCLNIACATNENHVRLSELISTVHFYLKEQQPESIVVKLHYDNMQVLTKDLNYWKLRDSVVQFEQLVLRVLQFDLTIDLPHKFLIFYLKTLGDWINNEPLIEELFLLSWSLVNDYFCNHPESIKWKPNHSALACIELAISVVSPDVKSLIENKPTEDGDGGSGRGGKVWYTNFDRSLKHDVISTIIDQILTASTQASTAATGKRSPSEMEQMKTECTHRKTCDSMEAK